MAKVVKKAPTDLNLHPLIINRWSPRALDVDDAISNDDLHAILEAARLAPSAFNEQPWRFIFGKRGEETFNQILAGLGEFNQMWAKNASALLLVTGVKQRSNGDAHPSYQYDLGLAVSQGTFEAHHRGYITHQMTGFSHDAMCKTFDLTTTDSQEYSTVTGMPNYSEDVVIYGAAWRMISFLDPSRLGPLSAEADVLDNQRGARSGENAARFLFNIYNTRLNEVAENQRRQFPIRSHYQR